MGSRVRFRWWEATFSSITFDNHQKDRDDQLLTSLEVRLAFGGPLELSSEAFHLPQALEDIME